MKSVCVVVPIIFSLIAVFSFLLLRVIYFDNNIIRCSEYVVPKPGHKGNNLNEIDKDAESVNSSLWWIRDPPVYTDKENWVRGWFPDKHLKEGKLEVPRNTSSFFWYCFNKYYKERWDRNISLAQYDLFKWLLVEPSVDLNRSCKAPPLLRPDKIQCTVQQPWANFKKETRKEPRKLAVAFKYGYETDILEMHLMEIYDVADKIFLMESTRAHSDNGAKLLFWEHLKWTPRFRRFQDKVVHLVLDDTMTVPKHRVGGSLESYQEKMRFRLVVEWNKKNKYFDDDDLVSFGDADEITSRNVLQTLKYCDTINKSHSIDVATWFVHQSIQGTQIGYAPIGKISRYSLGSPTFHYFGNCRKAYDENKVLSREKGRVSPEAVAGGIHLSWYPNPFQLLMKRLTCSECRFAGKLKWDGFQDLSSFSDWVLYSKPWKTFWYKPAPYEVRGTGDKTEAYPWVMVCNPFRYRPSVFMTNDDRILYTKEQLPFDSC